MADYVYLIKFDPSTEGGRAMQRVMGKQIGAAYLRLGVVAPLNAINLPPGYEAELLRADPLGLVVGLAEDASAPRALIPWQNVAYLVEEQSRTAARQPSPRPGASSLRFASAGGAASGA